MILDADKVVLHPGARVRPREHWAKYGPKCDGTVIGNNAARGYPMDMVIKFDNGVAQTYANWALYFIGPNMDPSRPIKRKITLGEA